MTRELEHFTQGFIASFGTNLERIWDKAADILSNENRSTQHPTHHQELQQFLSRSLEEYCNEIWDKATDILANDDQFSQQYNVGKLFQDCIEEHFNEVRDRAANLIGIDDWLSREDNKSTIYAKDERSQSPDADPAMGMAKDKKEIVIAVMGVTGAGKSSFIKGITSQDVFVGHGLNSATVKIKCYRFTHRGINFTLVDTPGFDDSSKSDEVIVNHILEWLASSFRNGIRLTGILYLHRIIDPRIGGEARQKMRMFRKLCGPDCMKNVVLGTTFWDRIAAEKGATREKELAANDEFWGILAKKGSRIVRIVTEDRECGLQILHDMAKNDIFIPEAQREMIEESKSAHNTSAAKTIHEEELEKMKTEMEAQLQAQRAKFENDLSRLEDERREKRRQERRQQSKIAAAQAKAAADKLATAQQEYWANFVLEQQIAEIAAEEVRERQIEEHNRMEREISATKEKLEREACLKREKRLEYYRNYTCQKSAHNVRNCKKCGVWMHGSYGYYHCCHCDGDEYHHCRNCGDNCGNEHHPQMSYHYEEAGCVVM